MGVFKALITRRPSKPVLGFPTRRWSSRRTPRIDHTFLCVSSSFALDGDFGQKDLTHSSGYFTQLGLIPIQFLVDNFLFVFVALFNRHLRRFFRLRFGFFLSGLGPSPTSLSIAVDKRRSLKLIIKTLCKLFIRETYVTYILETDLAESLPGKSSLSIGAVFSSFSSGFRPSG